MAKACGLRIGPRGYELVLLEGGAKKHKVIASEAGELAFTTDPEGAIETLKELAERHDIPKDGLRVVVEGGQAAFRKLNLPVNDDDKIEKVVKFEVESELPQFNIEDVVVDWTRISSTKDSCSLLTTVVKKEDLQAVLNVCEKGGVEPLEIDADTSAIVNAAAACGALDPGSACLVVFVGEDSSSIAVIDGGELRELRSIKQGGMTHIPAPVEQGAEEEAPIDDEIEEAEADAPEEADEGFPEEDEEAVFDEIELSEEEFLEDAHSSTGLEHEKQRQQVLARMQRELARTISGSRTLQPLERVIVAGYDMPGLIGSEILDVPVEALTGLPDTGSSASRCAAAYGAAVAQLGGGLMKANLRREELRFTGTMERLELPLAVAGLLLVTFLGVWNIGLGKELEKVDNAVLYWRDAAVNFMVPDDVEATNSAGNLKDPPKWFMDYKKRATGTDAEKNYRRDDVRNSFAQMTYIRKLLRQDVLNLERELGQGGDITHPQSALKGATYVLDVLDDSRAEGARPSIHSLKSTYNRGTSTKPDNVVVVLDVTFFAEDTATGTEHFEAFRRSVESKPWNIEFSPAKTEPLENGEGINIDRIMITMNVEKTEEAAS